MLTETISAPQLIKPVRGDAISRSIALVRHNTVMLLREPGPLISRIIMPLAFAIIMRPLDVKAEGTSAGTAQAITGSVVLFSMLAVGIVGSMIITERVWGTWDRMRSTVAHPFELLVGKVIPAMGVLLTQQIIILGFGALVQGMTVASPALLTVAVLSWTLALVGIGAALGVLARSVSELTALYDIGGVLLSGLGGAVVPLSVLPHYDHVIASVSPGYWAMDAMRGALQGSTQATLTASSVLLGIAVVTAAVVCARISRGGARSAKM